MILFRLLALRPKIMFGISLLMRVSGGSVFRLRSVPCWLCTMHRNVYMSDFSSPHRYHTLHTDECPGMRFFCYRKFGAGSSSWFVGRR